MSVESVLFFALLMKGGQSPSKLKPPKKRNINLQGNQQSKGAPNEDLRASGEAPSPHFTPKIKLGSRVRGERDATKMFKDELGKDLYKKLIKKPQQQEALNAAKKLLGRRKQQDHALRKQAVEKGLRTIGKAGGAYGVAAAEILIFTKNHWRVVVTLIATLFLFFFMIFDASSIDPDNPQSNNNTPTTNDTCAPQQASYGETSVCTITVTYNGSADNIIITSTILEGTAFVSAGQNGTYNKATNTVTWDAQKLGFQLNPINITVTVTVRVTTKQKNVKVWNAYDISPVNLSGSTADSNSGAAIPGNLPPTTNDCSGIYAHYMSITPGNQNYGDPNCSLIKKDANGVAYINKDAILSELKTLKPSEAMGWFICVVPNESGYNANAYLGASTSGKGAYGLVQMNPTGQGNGQYDNGKVVWPLQLSNGINYNDKVIGHSFGYWPTSYDPCLRSYGVSVP